MIDQPTGEAGTGEKNTFENMGCIRTIIPVESPFSRSRTLGSRAQYGTRMKADNLHLGDWCVSCKLL